ncbi:MAG: transporter substrate-binding domain-containing protein [Schwartzia sp.]|nr:transporter substrate-binding domain-containing protein [Schwartzia sp. (in: firmicutes)]
MAREICSRQGVEFVAQPISWDSKENDLDSKKIDCICSMSVTPNPKMISACRKRM